MEADWIWGLGGGLLIGLGGAVYLLGNGRIMGASGILGGLLDGSGRNTAAERSAFIAGVIGVPLLIGLLTGSTPDTQVTGNAGLLVLAGLLVGVGTRVANGCTSGHGVCGISRLSLRGIAATAVFMLAGILTLAVLRQILGVI
ncbi:YeeE/YedE family protein [Leisingera daeponensis]|uniref:YeeE/YedE family protein n=1 Tax=Leisingera daeponensis TaxID=405746 RepID=A0ABS7NBR3_9RHOB|nr:YeeE/YedE thiosulfate transporter family protein [Leisingera daeponensis]MBY6055739.1 YeeE/YedE family protein [Leisingera daeponensis]MBY6138645.1 YeeE/YedE family protein [Leisingera daeponensis]